MRVRPGDARECAEWYKPNRQATHSIWTRLRLTHAYPHSPLAIGHSMHHSLFVTPLTAPRRIMRLVCCRHARFTCGWWCLRCGAWKGRWHGCPNAFERLYSSLGGSLGSPLCAIEVGGNHAFEFGEWEGCINTSKPILFIPRNPS